MVKHKHFESGISYGMCSIVITCHICKKDIVVELSNHEYENYFINGYHIQDAMPNQPADIRELCISGTCGKCFDEIFADVEENRYPFSEGDDYWTIENGEPIWSCWDDQSELFHDENPNNQYFKSKKEAVNWINK